MNQNIYWFGLSGDPPTLAHQRIMKALSKQQGRNRVIVFPAGPLSYKRFTASKRDRRAMMRTWLLSAKFPKNVGLSWFDFNRKQAWSWYRLWNTLQKQSPQFNHWFIIGADQYIDIPKTWDHGKKLLEEARFMVVPRKGYPVPKLPSYHQALNIRPIGHSSTSVRKGSLRGLDPLTKAYILKKRLYV